MIACIESGGVDAISKPRQFSNPFAETMPFLHLNNVLNNNPSWLQNFGESDDFKCGRSAQFTSSSFPFSNAMTRAFG